MAIHSSILSRKKSHGQRSLAGHSTNSHKKSDTTEHTTFIFDSVSTCQEAFIFRKLTSHFNKEIFATYMNIFLRRMLLTIL